MNDNANIFICILFLCDDTYKKNKTMSDDGNIFICILPLKFIIIFQIKDSLRNIYLCTFPLHFFLPKHLTIQKSHCYF